MRKPSSSRRKWKSSRRNLPSSKISFLEGNQRNESLRLYHLQTNYGSECRCLNAYEQPPADNETVAKVEKKARNKGKRSQKPTRCDDSLTSRLHFDDSVPIEEIVIKDPELEALPKDQVESIGQDITYKLGQR